jgi:transcriptional regulator with XRE-family HTH domain
MKLSDLVRLRMAEKGMTRVEVERKGGLTDTTVAAILSGTATNPTLRVLLGLAKALELDPVEIFKAAAEVDEPEESWTAVTLIEAIQKMIFLKPGDIKKIKKLLGVK